MEKIISNIEKFIFQKGLKILFIFLFAFLLNLFLQSILKRAILEKLNKKILKEEKKKRVKTLISFLGGTLEFVIWSVAILIVLAEIGFNIGPILASMGLVGFAISMAAKDTISDFICGFFILLEGQFFVGDEVKIEGIEGKVVEFNLRRTIVEDKSGFLHYIPNSQIKILAKKIK